MKNIFFTISILLLLPSLVLGSNGYWDSMFWDQEPWYNSAFSGLSESVGTTLGGTQVTIAGLGFGPEQNSSSVAFGNKIATISSWSETKIVCITPAIPGGSVDVVITLYHGDSLILPNSFNYVVDTDTDGIPDDSDLCPGFDDNLDTDGDQIPDGCDSCPLDHPDDTDLDGVCDSDDPCPTDNPDDTDGDGVCDISDLCPHYNDTLDVDGDGIANCIDGDDFDNDGFTDAEEVLCGSDPADMNSRCSVGLPFLMLLLGD